MNICSIKGCKGKYHAKGYCIKHYNVLTRYGDPLYPTRIVDPTRGCKVEDCKVKHYGKGLCKLHYGRLRINGSVNIILPMIRICKIDICDSTHYGLGYCKKHYNRFRKYGNPNTVKIIHDSSRGCKIDGCEKKHRTCGFCEKHYRMDIYEKNRDSILEYKKQHRLEHRDEINEKDRKRRKDNPEKYLEKNKRYLEKFGNILNMKSIDFSYALMNWSLSIKKRDKCCKICGSTENLIAHHILYKNQHPELSLDLYNGVALCSQCHYDYHNLNGWNIDKFIL